MEGNKKFGQASTSFIGLAEYNYIVKDEPNGIESAHTCECINIMDEMKNIEASIQNLITKSSEKQIADSTEKVKKFENEILDAVVQLKKDLEFLVKQRDAIPEALTAMSNEEKETLSCSDPESVVHLVESLSKAVTTLGLADETSAKSLDWEHILRTVDEGLSKSLMPSLKKSVELIHSAMVDSNLQ